MKRKLAFLAIACICLLFGSVGCNRAAGNNGGGQPQSGISNVGDAFAGGHNEDGNQCRHDLKPNELECSVCHKKLAASFEFSQSEDENFYGVKEGVPTREGKIAIPEYYNGLQVKRIDDYAFFYCTDLLTVSIPDSVSQIGKSAFYECRNLKSVALPSGVKEIGEGAFRECTSLTSVILPESVETIPHYAFSDCNRLTRVYVPQSVKGICKSAFAKCSNLMNVVFESGSELAYINEYAFYDCFNLSNITLPENVSSIGRSAFDGCRSLYSVTIANSVNSVGSNAFSSCDKLTNIYFDGTMEQCKFLLSGTSSSGNMHGCTLHCSDGKLVIRL